MFWENFWPNFWSDLVAGVIIGSFLGWFLGRRLSALESGERQREELRGNLERGIQYLRLIQGEIEDLIASLPNELAKFKETGWGREIQIETPFWNSVDRSGELPRLLSPNMVRFLTRFYGHIALARRGKDLLVESWLVPRPDNVPGMQEKQKAFMQMTESGLETAINSAPRMLEHVRDNIEVLSNQRASLGEDA